MVMFNSQTPAAFFKKCADDLASNDVEKHILAKKTLNKIGSGPLLPPQVLNTLMAMSSDKEVANQVVGNYVLSLVKEASKVFPFSIKEDRSGTIGNRRFYPIEKRENSNVSLVVVKPGYVVNIPIVISGDKTKDNKRIQKILTKFKEESFGRNASTSKSKVASSLRIVFGGNHAKSIERSLNKAFKTFVKEYQPNKHTRLFGFFWKPVWEKGTKTVHLREVKAYYELLKKLDPELAEEKRKACEQPEEGMNSRVPYQDIRETIKNDEVTKISVAELRTIQNTRKVYLAIMDPDVIKLRNDKRGVFSHYNHLIKRHEAKHGCIPAIATTGYKADSNESNILVWGIYLDQRVREAIAKILALAPYIPEPNMILSVPVGKSTVTESFINRKSINKESRQITAHILAERHLSPNVAIAFQTLGAITTTVPERFYTQKNRSIKILTSQTIGQKQVLKALRGVRQSHINPLWGWSMNMESALSKNGSALRSQLSQIFNQFDPIFMAYSHQQGRYSANHFKAVLQIHSIQGDIFRRAIELYRSMPVIRNRFMEDDYPDELLEEAGDRSKQELNLSVMERKNFIAVLRARLSLVVESIEKLKEYELKEAEIFAVVEAARMSGKAMVKVFKEMTEQLDGNKA